MTIPVLLIGMLIAVGIFAALGWSVARAFQLQGRTRAIHIGHGALILLGMALISVSWPLTARFAGLVLVAVALWAAVIEDGLSKLFPLLGAAFGAALALGLPFA